MSDSCYMHTIKGFSENPRPRWKTPYSPDKTHEVEDYAKKPRAKKADPAQNLTMGTVSKADLGGKKVNPYAKPQPPRKPSEIVDRM